MTRDQMFVHRVQACWCSSSESVQDLTWMQIDGSVWTYAELFLSCSLRPLWSR